MGTDIHGFIEVRNSHIDTSEPDDELFLRWYPAMALEHVYDDRSYDAFGCLFGVRNRAFEPLAAQRGYPQDASRAAVRAFQEEFGTPTALPGSVGPSWRRRTGTNWND
ncbi:hypothetical protein [Streptomyces sp. ISL-98]|uniref:hypothetical protein n=1 Tax=Streptomyces sp. ISL-98 TaxID=2819192 RepID=UPI0020359264|nr:hypothetical protein [Streptomyces sp. ISL-98]